MKKFLRTSVIALALIILMQVAVCAYSIKLKLSTDTNKYDLKKEVSLTVDWGTKQEAAGFTISYDASKVKFTGSPDVTDSYYNSSTAGKVDVNWASLDGKQLTKMVFKFETIAEGTAEFSITADKDKFSIETNGQFISPDSIEIANPKASVTVAKPEEQKPETTKPGKEQEPEEKPKTEEEEKNTNTTNTTTDNTTKKDNTTAKGKMPQTGSEKTILFVIALISVAGIIGFKKYRGLSDI